MTTNASTKKKNKKRTFGAQVRRLLRARILSGLLIIVPLGITLFVINFLYEFTAGRLTPLIRRLSGPLPAYVVPLVSILVLVLFFYFLGLITSVVVGRKLVNIMEAVIQRIPFVKSIYGASKQIVLSLSLQDEQSGFESVVFIDFPYQGMKSLAFVTGRVEVDGEGEHLKVFVPTTPNPTSGYFELVPPENALPADISVEDAVALVMSGGIVTPDNLTYKPSRPEEAEPAGSLSRPGGD